MEGTGTQIATFATPPDLDDELPCSMKINGNKWKVGHQYLDTEIGDVCTLVRIIGRSSWRNTREAEDCPPQLVFEYERFEGMNHGTTRVDPNTPDPEFEERFIERFSKPAPRSAPAAPW